MSTEAVKTATYADICRYHEDKVDIKASGGIGSALSILDSVYASEARLRRICETELKIQRLMYLIDEPASIDEIVDSVSEDTDTMVDAVLAVCLLIREGKLRVEDPWNVTYGSLIEIAEGGC